MHLLSREAILLAHHVLLRDGDDHLGIHVRLLRRAVTDIRGRCNEAVATLGCVGRPEPVLLPLLNKYLGACGGPSVEVAQLSCLLSQCELPLSAHLDRQLETGDASRGGAVWVVEVAHFACVGSACRLVVERFLSARLLPL